MDELAEKRSMMVEDQIARRGLREPRLLAALRETPRHLFVPPQVARYAYEDRALSIGLGQTISQPYIVALMTSLLGLKGTETVLEVGTGSGYQAAILAKLAARVFTIEFDPQLAEQARQRLEGMGFDNIRFRQGDGSLGWPEDAPFGGILVTAGGPRVPPPLLEQLGEGGCLVMPVGSIWQQDLYAWRRTPAGLKQEFIAPVAFVPLRGSSGWGKN